MTNGLDSLHTLAERVRHLEAELKRWKAPVSPYNAPKLATLSRPGTIYVPADGWIPVSSTWTYASATTITVPSGAAAIYKVGQGVKLNNTDTKYFYIVGVADTLLTITGGSDYTLDSDAISAISYTNTPGTAIGFPVKFSYAPAWTASTTNPTLGSGTIYARFTVDGVHVKVWLRLTIGANTNTGAGNWAFSLPVTASTFSPMYIGAAHCRDTGVKSYIRTMYFEPGVSPNTTQYWVEDGTNVLTLTPTSPFTWANTDILMFTLEYLI